jgi:hypothetical protein
MLPTPIRTPCSRIAQLPISTPACARMGFTYANLMSMKNSHWVDLRCILRTSLDGIGSWNKAERGVMWLQTAHNARLAHVVLAACYWVQYTSILADQDSQIGLSNKPFDGNFCRDCRMTTNSSEGVGQGLLDLPIRQDCPGITLKGRPIS